MLNSGKSDIAGMKSRTWGIVKESTNVLHDRGYFSDESNLSSRFAAVKHVSG